MEIENILLAMVLFLKMTAHIWGYHLLHLIGFMK